MAVVNIRKEIDGNKLEGILIQAAADVALIAESHDEYGTEYSLSPVIKQQVYHGSEISLKKGPVELATISFNKDKCWNFFWIFPETEESVIEDYLNAVSKRI
jgi:hypothetical protein